MNLKDYIRPGKGATDITPLFENAEAYQELINRITSKLKDTDVSHIVAVEGRGFILGSAVAYAMNIGFIPVRYPGKLKNETYSETFVDYSGKEKTLQIHKDVLNTQENVAIIDDWIETGATVKATINLVEKCGGVVRSIVAFMDDSNDDLKLQLAKYNYSYLEKVEEGDNT
jgi:adenine phosphoribosyltransferase